MTWIENNCDGSGPHTGHETRVLPLGAGGNLILCRACYDNEIAFHRSENERLAQFAQFDLPAWDSLKVYAFEGSEHTPMTTTDGLDIVISNHREGYDYARLRAQEAIGIAPVCEQVKEGIWTVAEAEVFLLADSLHDWIELEIDDMPLVTFRDCVRAQLARYAFEDVAWCDLARHYLNVVREG